MSTSPLESWIKTKIGISAQEPLTRGALESYQLHRLRETVEYARQHSPFYRSRLAEVRGEEIRAPEDIARLPFTTTAELLEDERRFLCVSQGEIERVVTIRSSGTTAPPKRLHFTAEDLELTVDFFHRGMSTMVKPGDRVLILMPGELPGSVGDLLVKGLRRMEVEGIVHGLVRDAGEVIERIVSEEIHCLVGLPVQVLALARHPDAARIPLGWLKSVLLSADHVPSSVVRVLTAAWGVRVFNHYGMTEMGLGGGVECRRLRGYHLREADLWFEVVDPESGRPLPDGEPGEVVFTTLTRRGMPLIRYRTGDRARFLPDPCSCGTVLRRLERVRGRLAGDIILAGGHRLNIAELDEVLFPLPFLLDYQAVVRSDDGRACLDIAIETTAAAGGEAPPLVRRALLEVRAVRRAVADGRLMLGAVGRDAFARSISIKRTVVDRRKEQ
ncbi:DVU_1553 family AMP-dependent CoA ligase [Geobacter sp.]|uniref:DVU_1553 family AMP-dependent CoA ligase n=1 Tax=Geobacter sp. TaxID=46610 RepID=UPI00261DDE7E|nr:AMP-binding protein [Geobacter sp.]